MLLLDGGQVLWDAGSSFFEGWSQEFYLVNKASSYRHMVWCRGILKLVLWAFVKHSFLIISTYWMEAPWETVFTQTGKWRVTVILWSKNTFQWCKNFGLLRTNSRLEILPIIIMTTMIKVINVSWADTPCKYSLNIK